MTSIFSPIRIGAMELPQRFVMAPLTRNRAGEGMAPTALNAEYYAQRAGAGLIIAEGSQPSAVGQGYLNSPGIHTTEQVQGWRKVADGVHEEGGHIFVQLMHSGRVAHPDNKDGLESVAPSAIAAPGTIVTASGPQNYVMPRALETDEMPGVVAEFVHAARCAVEAGLDGVEIHAANGYLLQQFLAPSTNVRDDEYGGSPANRSRLAIDTITAVAEAIGPERVGVRISPAHNVQGVLEEDPEDTRATYESLVTGIAGLGLAYLSVLADPTADLTTRLRAAFDGPFMLNSGFASITTKEDAERIITDDLADLVAVGRPFLANPDLAERWRTDASLNQPHKETFYGGGAHGYTDYPRMEAA